MTEPKSRHPKQTKTLPSRSLAPCPKLAREKLEQIPSRQFVCACGGKPDLTRKRFFWTCAAGAMRYLKAYGRLGLDLRAHTDASEDLLDPRVQAQILDLSALGAFYVVGDGPVCTSMSRAALGCPDTASKAHRMPCTKVAEPPKEGELHPRPGPARMEPARNQRRVDAAAICGLWAACASARPTYRSG